MRCSAIRAREPYFAALATTFVNARIMACGLQQYLAARRSFVADVAPDVGNQVRHGLQRQVQVDGLARLGVIDTADEGQCRRQHRFHNLDVGQHFRLFIRDVVRLDPQSQPRQRRPQVVADGAEHQRAVGEHALQPDLHLVESADRAPQLRRALLRKRRRMDVEADPLGGTRKPHQRRVHHPREPRPQPTQNEHEECGDRRLFYESEAMLPADRGHDREHAAAGQPDLDPLEPGFDPAGRRAHLHLID